MSSIYELQKSAIENSLETGGGHYHINPKEAAIECEKITKEWMKKFAEWITKNYVASYTENNKWLKIGDNSDNRTYTTEEMLNLFLEEEQ